MPSPKPVPEKVHRMVGKRIRFIRITLGLSEAELASRLKVKSTDGFQHRNRESADHALRPSAVREGARHNAPAFDEGHLVKKRRLAAGMATQAVAFLQRANWLTPLDTVMWDSGWLLSESSIVGRALHTLVGYTDQPTEMQIVIYLAVILVTVMLMRLVGSGRRQHATAAG